MRSLNRWLVVLTAATLAACGGGDHGGHGDGSLPDHTLFDSTVDGHGDGNDVSSDGRTIPDGSTIEPDGAVILPDGAIWNPDASTIEIPDGATLEPDGAVILADGAIWNPDASTMQIPDGATLEPDGAVILADGAIWNPDGSMVMDGGMSGPPDGSVMEPDGAWILPDGAIWNPDSATIPDGGFILPDGAIYDPSDASCPPLSDGGAACGTHEICNNGLDDNCNGQVDEGCACLPGNHQRCYLGCSSQAGVGECHFGTQTCMGTEIGTWGPCTGSGHPSMVVCGGLRDYLCDGMIDEGCSCAPGDMRPCYDGPSATRGVGACHDGVQVCAADSDGGTAWGTCNGEQLPTAPACDGIDHACDGMPFEGCACTPGATRMCYDGPPGTSGVGVCHGGMQSCVVSGGMAMWGPCVGEVTPSADMCDGIDRLCNGMPNPGCACVPGATRACYDGPPLTRGVGLCHDGMQSCVSVGGATMWGPCAGEQTPTPELCDGLDHLCNGMPNTGCPCTPGVTRSCYDGPPGTAGVGLCHAGSQTCIAGPGGVGSSWGACTGEVTPTADRCDGIDRLCNGSPDPGCTCMAGSTRTCYDGPSGTAGVGQCRSGTQTCNATGTGWGPCTGEVLPSAEICDGIDHLCNGMPNTGCACTPGAMQACYDGPAGTNGVGVCHGGSQTCVAGPGGVGSSWGPCGGEVLPSANTCDGVDRMCTGNPYAGCLCIPGTARSCYTGPAGTSGVGLCHAGMQSCINSGGGPMWGPCTGQVTPGPEVCDGLDHLCNGMPNTGCFCTPGTSQACYSGPPGTAGVGVCRAGMQMCVCGPGNVGCNWGACTGEIDPGPVTCDGLDHACDGNYSADCPCMLGQTRACYSGPAGTAGVGTCHAGTQSCVARGGGGTQWGTCAGEVDPAPPQCDGLDHACSGMLPNCNPTVMCPAPVMTQVGLTVTLSGSASAIPPATIVSYRWSVIAQPVGSTYMFSSTTTNPTMFTANNAGVYTVQFTATDSMGRSASCSVLITVASPSYLGTEFWPVATTNAQLMSGNVFDFAIAVGNPNASPVNAVVSGGALGAPVMFTVPANSTVTQTLPWVPGLSNNSIVLGGCSAGCCDLNCCPFSTFTPPVSGLVSSGAYHLTTSAPVSAYQFNALQFNSTRLCNNPNGAGTNGTNSYTNDASLLLPTPALTGNYLVLSHQAWDQDGAFIAITGTNPSPTTVMVTLTAGVTTGPGVPSAGGAGVTQTYTLNYGDVVQLISQHTPGTLGYDTQDFTGTVIAANHAVSVIAGVDCSFMSNTGTCYACDHLEQQLFPQETWGHDVVISQLVDRAPPGGGAGLWTAEPYFVRILSRDNGNTLSFTPGAVHANVTLNRGQFVEFCANSDFEVQSISATPGAFLVEQYMVGQNVTGCGTCSPTGGSTTASLGDPASVLEVPTAQYRTNYNFVVPATYTSSFINVVVPSGETVTLDGVALSAVPVTIAGTSWQVYRQAVSAGSHIAATAGGRGFGLKVLGVAAYTSYAYPGGLDLATLP